MCDADIMPHQIEWMGWKTTWDALRAAGWETTHRTPHWKVGNRSYEKVYIRNRKTCYVGRLTLNPWKVADDFTASLDYLTHERNQRKKPVPVIIEELTVEDIPALYEAILRLQKESYPKPVKEDNIIPLPKKSTAA
jgi:hypothetical protein